ncbi:MAG TPA: hypothetical protein VI072_29270 [Polyangiaceae bacterium]
MFYGAGCSVYDESLLGETAAPAECQLARWPEPPAGTGLGGDTTFVTALQSFDFGEEHVSLEGQPVPERQTVGYDLDKLCTQNEELNDRTLTDENSCAPVAGWFSPRYGDLKGGRDNGLRYLIKFVADAFKGSSENDLPISFGTPIYNVAIQSGEVSLLMQVEGYNEQPDDDSVVFKLYTPGSFGMANPDVPKFDGRDEWPVARDSFEGENSNVPKWVSERAYVTNNVLVARLRSADLRLRVGIAETQVVDLILRFVDPFFTARIEKLDNVWRLRQGQVAARWRTADLFSQVKFFPNPLYEPGNAAPSNTQYMCASSAGYPFVREAICGSTDIVATAAGPGDICDSISVGIGFEAVQARLGGTVDLDPPLSDCTDAFDPVRDACSKETHPDLVNEGLAVPATAP